MTPTELRYEVARDMYQAQRSRREQVRASVGTPVAALAFTVFNLSTLATTYGANAWSHPVNLIVGVLAVMTVIFLVFGAILIVRMEWNVLYIDPPDIEEVYRIERTYLESGEYSETETAHQVQGMLGGAYDIAYRRYFAANEQAARDRTRGLHLILISLALLSVAFMLLPFQAGGTS